MRKAFIEDLFLLMVTLLTALYFVVDLIDPLQTVALIGFKPFVVTSPSMTPTIDPFDMVIVTRIDPDEIEERDIITFKAYIPEIDGIGLVTHYIADIRTVDGITIYKTQGENRQPGDYDVWRNETGQIVDITADDIIGQVAFTIPYVGLYIAALRDPILLLAIIINLTILFVFIKYVRYIRREPAGKSK